MFFSDYSVRGLSARFLVIFAFQTGADGQRRLHFQRLRLLYNRRLIKQLPMSFRGHSLRLYASSLLSSPSLTPSLSPDTDPSAWLDPADSG
ncbi:hypothetical protein BKA63DRAFT_514732 [Paraphoma chrysanthemicola]|nr:hypothetical protein BKA63DRAFT_514732 [Paraphoma chrysanthemicola]